MKVCACTASLHFDRGSQLSFTFLCEYDFHLRYTKHLLIHKMRAMSSIGVVIAQVVSVAFAEKEISRVLREKMQSCRQFYAPRQRKLAPPVKGVVMGVDKTSPVRSLRFGSLQHFQKKLAIFDREIDEEESGGSSESVGRFAERPYLGRESPSLDTGTNRKEALGVASTCLDVCPQCCGQHIFDRWDLRGKFAGGSSDLADPLVSDRVVGGVKICSCATHALFTAGIGEACDREEVKYMVPPEMCKDPPSSGMSTGLEFTVNRLDGGDRDCPDKTSHSLSKDAGLVGDMHSHIAHFPHLLGDRSSSQDDLNPAKVFPRYISQKTNPFTTSVGELRAPLSPVHLTGKNTAKETAESKPSPCIPYALSFTHHQSKGRVITDVEEEVNILGEEGNIALKKYGPSIGKVPKASTISSTDGASIHFENKAVDWATTHIVADSARAREAVADTGKKEFTGVPRMAMAATADDQEQGVRKMTDCSQFSGVALKGTVSVPEVELVDRDLFLRKQNSVKMADEEEYASDDFEGQKHVRFTDETQWIVHEVRASFERHELSELFYTTTELDCMLAEAEQEETLRAGTFQDGEGPAERRRPFETKNLLDVDIETQREVEDVLFDSYSFDGDDSDELF